MAKHAGRLHGSVVSQGRKKMLEPSLSRSWRALLAKSGISRVIDVLRTVAAGWPNDTQPRAQYCTVRTSSLTDRIRRRKRLPTAM
jgi:hypothetical protein